MAIEVRTAVIAAAASVVSAVSTIGVAYMGGLFQVQNSRTVSEGTVTLEKLKFGNEVVKDALSKENPANSLLFYANIGLLEGLGLKVDKINEYANDEKKRQETGGGGESLLPSFDKAARPALWLDRPFLEAFVPNAEPKFVDALVGIGNYLLLGFGIDKNPARLSMFLGHFAMATGGFRLVEENANYSRNGLLRTFSKRHFSEENVDQYTNQPEKILNRVYAEEFGNGPEASGDGWKYRGRGVLQITGRDNYKKFADETGIDLIDNPDLAADPNVSILIATTFWYNNGLNDFADQGDVKGIAKKLSNGLGIAESKKYSDAALALLQEKQNNAPQ